ncbi:MAG TPA: hypothetical protein VI278_09210 [Nitrososphaeraceae archaeon]
MKDLLANLSQQTLQAHIDGDNGEAKYTQFVVSRMLKTNVIATPNGNNRIEVKNLLFS